MPVPTDPYTFSDAPGNTASGVQVNQRFNALYAALNPAVTGLDYQNVQANGLRETNMATAGNGLAKGAFSAYRAAAVSLASLAVVVMDTEEFDVSGWHDTATGRFTPQVAGYYRFAWGVETAGALAADTHFQANLRKNGTIVKGGTRCFQRGAVGVVSTGATEAILANGSTDFFEVAVFHNGGTPAVQTGVASTFFTGGLVGRS